MELHREERGGVLLTVLAVMAIFSIIIFGLLWAVNYDLRRSKDDYRQAQAFYAANAGLEAGLSQLLADPAFTGETGGLRTGTYQTTVTTAGNLSTVVSVGRSLEAPFRTVTLEAAVRWNGFPSAQPVTVLRGGPGDNALVFNGNDAIDGDLVTNGAVSGNWNNRKSGRLVAPPQGSEGELFPPPELDFAALLASGLPLADSVGDRSYAGETLLLQGDVTIPAGTCISVDGSVTFVIDGSLTIGDGAAVLYGDCSQLAKPNIDICEFPGTGESVAFLVRDSITVGEGAALEGYYYAGGPFRLDRATVHGLINAEALEWIGRGDMKLDLCQGWEEPLSTTPGFTASAPVVESWLRR